MNEIQLRQVDLNLLVVLDVLLREQSVSRAATQLHLTPSAVSHALKRLRVLFDDELLVRDGRRMRPTSRAEGLAQTLPRLLQQLARTLSPPAPFEPERSTRTFRLVAPDFIAPLVPLLLRDITRTAPHVRVELLPLSPRGVQDVADGHTDGLIAPQALAPDGLRGRPLGAWDWAVYGRPDHPAFARWSLSAWAAYPHLQVRTSVREGKGPIDRRTEALGVQRTVGAVVPHFTMAAPVLAHTDLLLTVPSVAMTTASRVYGLTRRPVPFELPGMHLALFRSATEGDEPGVRWFLDRVFAACRALHAPTADADAMM